MKSFTDLNFNLRLSLSLSAVILVLTIIVGILLYSFQKKRIEKETDIRMQEQLDDLTTLLEMYASVGKHDFSSVPAEIVRKTADRIKGMVTSDSLPLNAEEIIDTVAIKQLLARISVNGKNFDRIKQAYYAKKYFESGYPYVVSNQGILLIHPDSEGKDVSQTEFFRYMTATDAGNGVFRYLWPENKTGKTKVQYFKYIETYQAYTAITFYESEMYGQSGNFMFVLILLFVIALALVNFLVYIINVEFKQIVNKLAKTISSMSKGHLVDPIDYDFKNEIGHIVKSINVLIDGLRRTMEFSTQIGKANLKSDFTPLSEDDMLGNSLLEMRRSLIASQQEEIIRKKEDDKQKWSTNGLAKFADLLRQDNDDIEKLSYNIISNLVKYTGANQGGMFVINDDDPDDLHYELKAAFAYDKHKYITKRVDPGIGIIGRATLERESVHLTEIPDGYIEITSGLGEANPRSLLVVPLNMNNEIYGAIELASFTDFEPNEIEFVQKIAESVTSTISVVKINVRTARLLSESEKQAKKLEQQEEKMRRNLDELRATQEEAARNEEAALGFVNAVNHTIIRADFNLDGTIRYANTKLLEIMQYTSSELMAQHFSVFMDVEEARKFDKIWESLIKGGKHYEEEVLYKTKYGSIWLLATYTAVRDNKGKVVSILYLAIDISKEKRKNLQYHNDIKAIDNSVLKAEYDLDGNIIEMNKILLKTLGFNAEDRIGKNLFELQSKAELNKSKALWSQLLTGIAGERQERFATKDGREKWFKGTYTPVVDDLGEIHKIIYIANEMTEQKELEIESKRRNVELEEQGIILHKNMEELTATQTKMKEKELEMTGLIHAINIATFSAELDLNGTILKINEQYSKAFGLHSDDFVGKNDRDFMDLSTPESRDEYSRFWDEIRFGLSKTRINHISLNNKTIWLNETFTPIVDQSNRPYKVLLIATDITKTKLLELEAKHRSEELQSQEEELRQNLEELQATQEDLEHKIVENKRIQDELAREKYLMDALMDSVPDSIYFKDRESRFLRISSSLNKLFNVTDAREVVGKSDFNYFAFEHANQAYNDEQQIIRTGVPMLNYIEKETWEDGRTTWVSSTKMPLRDETGTIVGTFGISKDVTQIKQLETEIVQQNEELKAQKEELRQNLEELQATQEELERRAEENEAITKDLEREQYLMDALMDTLPDSIFFKDVDSRFLRISKSTVPKFGVSDSKEIIGKTDFNFFASEHARKAYNDEQQIIKSGTPMIDVIEKETYGDGRTAYSSTTKMPLRDAKGNVVGTFGISKDITAVKELEVKLNIQNEELRSQKEELRQNLEELQATQEDLVFKIAENEKIRTDLEKEMYLMDALMDTLPDSIYFKDNESRFLRISKSTVPKFNVSDASEIIGKSDFNFFAAEHARKAYNDEQTIIKTGVPMLNVIEKETWDDGTVAWAATTKMPLRNKNGEIVGTFGITKDITDIKKLEVELGEHNRELNSQKEELRQNLEELQTTQEELERRAEENEKVRTELELEKYLMDALLNTIPDAIYFKDRNSCFLRTSKSMLKNFNVTKNDELKGKSDFDFFSREQALDKYNMEQQIITTGKGVVNFIEQSTTLNGDERWVSSTKLPMYDQNGGVIGLFGISRDITDLKFMEQNLKAQNEQLQTSEEELKQNLEELQATQEELERRMAENEKIKQDLEKEQYLMNALMDTIPDSIYFKDTESRFLRVTKSMVPKFNATEYSQIIGKTDFDFFAREHAKQAYDDEQEIIRIGKPLINVIEKETWEDGSISWVSSTKMPLRDSTGRIVGTFGISKDITSIKQMENELTEHNNALSAQKEELQQTLQQLQTTQSEMQVLKELETKKQKEMLETIDNNRRMLMKVIDNVPGKIFLKDNEGKIMLVNTEMAKTYGMSAEELIGKTDFNFYTETDAKRRKEAENEIISGGRKTFIETEEIAGEKHYYRTTLMPFFIAHLNQKGILSVQADITEIKTMEIEMKRRNEELHAQDEELRQTLEEIQATNEELERLKEADARHNKEMMEKIETHRKTLFDIIDHIPGKIFLKDSKSRMVLVNSLVAKVHGVKAEELIGKDDFDFFDKEIAQGLFDEEQSIIRGGKPKSYIQTEDLSGEARVLHTTKMPFYINYLGETGLLGVQTDITDIKRQEDEIVRQNELMKELQNELSAENAMFQTLMENIPEQITFKDLKGSYKRINKSKAKAIGLSEVSDAKNKTDFDFLDKKLAQKLARDDKRILKWGESMYNEEDRITLADGTTQWTATTKVPYSLNTGEIEGVIEIVRDISETKIAKAEVWTKDKLISGLAMKLPSLVFNLDKGGEITKIFGGALKSLKFKEKDLIGKSITEIYPKLADKLAKGLKNEEFKFSTDMEGKHFESVVFDNEITELISGYSVEI